MVDAPPLIRIPHDHDYVCRLGAAVYAFAYLEWRIVELIRLLAPTTDIRKLSNLSSGGIAKQLREALVAPHVGEEAELGIGDRFADLVLLRNDLLHAHPVTDPERRQRLSRWAPIRGRFGLQSDDVITHFLEAVEALDRDAGKVVVRLRNAGYSYK